MNVLERINLLKKMVKEVEKILNWQLDINTALHNIHADWVVSGVLALARIPEVTASGSYTGNSSVNRAIPHGLGVIPKLVMLKRSNDAVWFRIFGAQAMIGHWYFGLSMGQLAVTIPNSTNFYIGNATSYPNSANNSGDDYYWVAIG